MAQLSNQERVTIYVGVAITLVGIGLAVWSHSLVGPAIAITGALIAFAVRTRSDRRETRSAWESASAAPTDIESLPQLADTVTAARTDEDNVDTDGLTGIRALSESTFRSMCGGLLYSAVTIGAISTVFGIINGNVWAVAPAALSVGCAATLCTRSFALTVGGEARIPDIVYTWWRFVGRWLALSGLVLSVAALTVAFWGTQR